MLLDAPLAEGVPAARGHRLIDQLEADGALVGFEKRLEQVVHELNIL